MLNTMKKFYFNGRFRKLKDIDIEQYARLSHELLEQKKHLDNTLPQLYKNIQAHYENSNLKYVQNEMGIIKSKLRVYHEECARCAIAFHTKDVEHFARCFLAYYNSLTK